MSNDGNGNGNGNGNTTTPLPIATLDEEGLRAGVLRFQSHESGRQTLLDGTAVKQARNVVREYNRESNKINGDDRLGRSVTRVDLEGLFITPDGAQELVKWLNAGIADEITTQAGARKAPLLLRLAATCNLTAGILSVLSQSWAGEGARVSSLYIMGDIDKKAYEALHASFKTPSNILENYRHEHEVTRNEIVNAQRREEVLDYCKTLASPHCKLKRYFLATGSGTSPEFDKRLEDTLVETIGSKDCSLESLEYRPDHAVTPDTVRRFADALAQNRHLSHFTLKPWKSGIQHQLPSDGFAGSEINGEKIFATKAIAKMLYENPRIVNFDIPSSTIHPDLVSGIGEALEHSQHPNLLFFNYHDFDSAPFGSTASPAIHNHCMANARRVSDLAKAIFNNRVTEEQKSEIALRKEAIREFCNDQFRMHELDTKGERNPNPAEVSMRHHMIMAYVDSNRAQPKAAAEAEQPFNSVAGSFARNLKHEGTRARKEFEGWLYGEESGKRPPERTAGRG